MKKCHGTAAGPNISTNASKHAGSDLHPVWIGWETFARNRPDESCTLACFQTRSVKPKPDTISQNYIGSGLVLYIIRDICGRTQLVAGRLYPARNQAQ